MNYSMNCSLAVVCVVSMQTLLRTFRCLHFSRKHISAYALERNEEKRAILMNSTAEIVPDPEMLS
ncbi:hypothetical protein BDR04DRAFT_177209 [Suillus decipiens]|nr:hypothetical protein BDR04DRAFT_177209 [Suillus decipiens]